MSTTPKDIEPIDAKRTRQLQAARSIDAIAAKATELFGQADGLEKELAVAQSVADLRAALTDEVMSPIMSVMNSDLGFRTDRDPRVPDKDGKSPTPYSISVVREVFIEARLRGFHLIGNEINIIAGRFYAAKNGLRRKVTRWPGLTEFKESYDVPRIVGDKGAVVKCKATWSLKGVADVIDAEIPVRVNSFMGIDAIIGKAQRKLLARVHDRLSGQSTPEGEIDDEPIKQAKAETVAPTGFGKEEPKREEKTDKPEKEKTDKPEKEKAEPAKPDKADTGGQNGHEETPQEQLGKILTDNGYTLADFIAWAVDQGRIPARDADSIPDIDAVPSQLAKLCIGAERGLLQGLARTKGAAA